MYYANTMYTITIYTIQCIQENVYKTMYKIYIYKPMYTRQCIQKSVYKTMYL